MKVLYIYSHKLTKHNNNFYHPYLNSIIDRYLFFSNDLTVLLSNKFDEKFDKFSERTIFPSNVKLSFFDDLKNIGTLFRRDVDIIEEEVKSADLIITKLPSFEGNYAVKYAKKHNKTILVEMVGCPWDAYWNHSLKGKLIAPYIALLTKRNVKRADYVIYVTQQFLQSRYPNMKESIGCSDVNISAFNKEILREKYVDFQNKKVINLGTSAAIDVKYKGQGDIIKVMSKLKKKNIIFNYYLAGGGDKSRLERLARDLGVLNQVFFLGMLDKEGVDDFLDKTDVYIQPSRQEGLSRALVEAMSRGCFCMATNVGGNPELIDEEFIWNPGDLGKIESMLQNLEYKTMESQSKINYVKAQNFDKDFLNKRRREFYESIKISLLK